MPSQNAIPNGLPLLIICPIQHRHISLKGYRCCLMVKKKKVNANKSREKAQKHRVISIIQAVRGG